MLLRALTLTLCILSASAFAQQFQNQFIEFKIPENWDCRVEGTEWVCMSNNPKIKKETIVVFAAKVAGAQDTLKEYLAYLKQPRRLTDLQGKPLESTVRYAKHKNIGGHTWVDALHINGEIPGFITRYLATTFQELGILVTYSVLESRWDAYEGMFRHLVDSLTPRRGTGPEVTQKETAMTDIPIASLLEKESGPPEAAPQELEVTQAPPSEEGGGLLPIILLLLAIGGAAVFFILRRKKQQAPPPTEGEEGAEEEFEDDEEKEE